MGRLEEKGDNNIQENKSYDIYMFSKFNQYCLYVIVDNYNLSIKSFSVKNNNCNLIFKKFKIDRKFVYKVIFKYKILLFFYLSKNQMI